MMNMFLNNIYVSISRSSQTGIKKCTFSGVTHTEVKMVHLIVKYDLFRSKMTSGKNDRFRVKMPVKASVFPIPWR